MAYKIKFTDKFLDDINSICGYIETYLKSNCASIMLRKKVINLLEDLAKNPKMYSKIEKTDKLRRTFRRIVVDNYVLLYTIDEGNEIIYISHMYFSGRNYLEGLI